MITSLKKFIPLALIPLFAFTFVGIAKADNDHGRDNELRRASGSTLEVHINDNGKTLVRGAKVTAVSGSVITATTTFGTNVMTWTVNTTSNTQFVRKFGGVSSTAEIQVGDFLSFSGMLSTTATGLTVDATIVKDWSIQARNDSFKGTISSIDATTLSFVLASENRGNITVKTATTTQIKKGNLVITFADLHVGDKIDKTDGLYNNLTLTLTANSVKVKADQSQGNGNQNSQVFEGTLQSLSATTTPTTLALMVGGTSYTVNIPTGISILNKNWLITSLTTFQVGDIVRVYGALQSGTTIIDASVVRDASR